MSSRHQRPPRAGSRAAGGLCLALLLVLSGVAHGAPRVSEEDLWTELTAGDDARVRAALSTLAKRADGQAVAVMARAIRHGLADAHTDTAVEALGQARSASAIEVLAELASHRRPMVRQKALEALSRIDDPQVPELVSRGLRDSKPGVRGAAARLLGALGDRTMVDVLFTAFRRGVPEAAAAIGLLADEAGLARYHTFLTKKPLHVMLQGYASFLKRQDVATPIKLAIVGQLEEISGGEVKDFLRKVLVQIPWKSQPEVRQAIMASLKRIVVAP